MSLGRDHRHKGTFWMSTLEWGGQLDRTQADDLDHLFTTDGNVVAFFQAPFRRDVNDRVSFGRSFCQLNFRGLDIKATSTVSYTDEFTNKASMTENVLTFLNS